MRTSGKIVVFSIFAVALVMAAFAWWWNRDSGYRSLQFWGNDRALIIRDAPQVQTYEVLPLSAVPKAGAGTVMVKKHQGNQILLQLDDAQDISSAPGLVHARHSLLQDPSFSWAAEPLSALQDSRNPPRCKYAVRFIDTTGTVTILFDFQDQYMYCVESQDGIKMSEKSRAGWLSYVRRNRTVFSPQKGDSPEPE